MNNVIVIINPPSRSDLSNIQKDATEGQPNTSGVKQLCDRAWLIDPHTSHAFIIALLHSAHERGCETFVYEVLDTIQDHTLSSTIHLEPK